jgi:hypothetical protein
VHASAAPVTIFSTRISGCAIVRRGTGDSPESHRQPFWRTKDPEMQKPAWRAGLSHRPRPRKVDLVNRTFLELRPSVKRKPCFRRWVVLCRFPAPSRRAVSRKEQPMRSFAQYLPALPGFTGPKTYAAWPVWSDSTTKEIRFQPVGFPDANVRKTTSDLTESQWDQAVSLFSVPPFGGPVFGSILRGGRPTKLGTLCSCSGTGTAA